MSKIGFQDLADTLNREPVNVIEGTKRSVLFGENVFNESTMRQYLTKDAFNGVMSAIDHGTKIDLEIADQVSSAMKEWTLSKGVAHYTH